MPNRINRRSRDTLYRSTKEDTTKLVKPIPPFFFFFHGARLIRRRGRRTLCGNRSHRHTVKTIDLSLHLRGWLINGLFIAPVWFLLFLNVSARADARASVTHPSKRVHSEISAREAEAETETEFLLRERTALCARKRALSLAIDSPKRDAREGYTRQFFLDASFNLDVLIKPSMWLHWTTRGLRGRVSKSSLRSFFDSVN